MVFCFLFRPLFLFLGETKYLAVICPYLIAEVKIISGSVQNAFTVMTK